MRALYSVPQTFNVVVNPGPAVPIARNRIGVETVILTASIGNFGLIYVGGPTCDVASGQELDGGRGILLTASGSMAYQESMESMLGSGPNLNMRGAYAPGAQSPLVLIQLDHIYVTASLAAQNLRVLFMVPVRHP